MKSTLIRIDNIAIVVEDMKAAIAFFTELGMEPQGGTTVEGEWVDRTVGLKDVQSEIFMMQTPDGHSKLELTTYHRPVAGSADPKNPPGNTLGLHRIMFTVSDLREVLARLETRGATLIGEVVQYENMYLLCYLRGPEGIVVALAQPLKREPLNS